MATVQESALVAIFMLTFTVLLLVPCTLIKVCCLACRKTKSDVIHCRCSVCARSGKYRKSVLRRIWNFSTFWNLSLVLLWITMGLLIFYINRLSREIRQFDPYAILGLERGASDVDIKKAYRRLSIQYHPDKNPDPEAHKHFVEFISKAYQALTDPVSRENYERFGHPDGMQWMQVGMALPQFVLNFDKDSSGLLLLGIVGVCILLPLIAAVVYLSKSSKYSGNYVMNKTLSAFANSIKPSLAPSKVLGVLVKSSEFLEIPVRRTDDEPLQKLFQAVGGELSIDLKKNKSELAKFWKQHPALIKAELLLHAHLTRETGALTPSMRLDLKRVLELTPRLLEEFIKISVMPRSPNAHGWLRPAMGAVELSQCVIQAVPLNARKAVAGSGEGIAPLLQLPHFDEEIITKIARKSIRTLQELRDLPIAERAALLTEAAGLSAATANDVETVLEAMPAVAAEITCTTEGEKEIQEGDIVTIAAWLNLRRKSSRRTTLVHSPYYPFPKEEGFWLVLADPAANSVWFSQKVSFGDDAGAAAATAAAVAEAAEARGESGKETSAAAREAVKKVKAGWRLVMGNFLAPSAGNYNLCCFCLSDSWIGCDWKTELSLKVSKQSRAGTRGSLQARNDVIEEEEEEEEEEDDDDDDDEGGSEYSDEEDLPSKKKR
ncbi:dnaJ protein ERDJ2-like [Wolffia australiana]